MDFKELLNLAARDLPPGYQIDISVEKNSAWCTLLDQFGDDIGVGDCTSEAVLELIQEARKHAAQE